MRIAIPMIAFGKAGGYRTLSEFATNWMKLGHKVDFIVSLDVKPYFPTEANIILINYKGESVTNQCSKCQRSTLRRFNALIRYISNNNTDYDVILASHNMTALLTYLGTRKNLFYYIQAYEPEFYPIHFGKNGIMHFIALCTYKLPHVKIVNADIYKNYKSLHSQHVIAPGLNLDVFHTKKTYWNGKDTFVVGCIGRIEEWKGANDVSKAVGFLIEGGKDVTLKVAFNQVDSDYKYELVKPDGDENLAAYYRSLDVLVAPGHIQLGAVHYPVIEAMASGVPVITTGYYPANSTNAFIVPIKSPESIAAVIDNMMQNYDEALTKAGVAIEQIQEFSWDTVSQKFLEIFKKEKGL